MTDGPAAPSVSALIGDVGARAAALIRAELNLFGAEMRVKAASGVNACLWLGGGAALVMAGAAFGLTAVLYALISYGVRPHVAAAVLALFLGCGGILLVRYGLSQLRRVSLHPEHTLDQLRQDAAILKRQARNG